MKCLKLCGVFILGMIPGLSQAAETQFSIEMFYGTCPVAVFVEGNVKNMVQLGTVPPGGVGVTKSFTIKAINPVSWFCKSYSEIGRTAKIGFTSGDMNGNGLADYDDPSNGSFVRIFPANGITSGDVTRNNPYSTFTIDKINAEGFRFNTELHGGAKAGSFRGAVAYVITYFR